MQIYKFSTPDCSWCKIVAPHVEGYAKEHGMELTEVNADADTGTDQDKELTGRFGVMSVPTVIIEDNHKEMVKATGYGEIMQLINE